MVGGGTWLKSSDAMFMCSTHRSTCSGWPRTVQYSTRACIADAHVFVMLLE